MMREFQAEDDRRQTLTETNLTVLINATAIHTNLTATSHDQPTISCKPKQSSENDLNPTKINKNTPERRSIVDRTKVNRLPSDTLKVRLCFIQNYFLIEFIHRHQDVRQMTQIIVYLIFIYESNRVAR
jgi:hypothetical protein